MRQGVGRAMLAPLLLVALATPAAFASHDGGSGPRSLGGATVPQDVPVLARIEAENFTAKDAGAAVNDSAATGGTAWRMPTYGRITTDVDVPQTGVVWVRVRARGEHPPGLMSTHMHPAVDGEQRGEWDVGPQYLTFLQSIPMRAGRHALSVDNFNNYHAPAEDRTLVVDWVEVTMPTLEGSPRVGQAAEALVDGPEVHMAGTGLAMTWDEGARNKTSWHMWGVGCFAESVVFDHAGTYLLSARLRGNERHGEGSHTVVRLDGTRIDELNVGDAWVARETTFQSQGGASVLEICYDNDFGGDLKRNLWMDEIRVARVGEAPSPATPAPPTPTSAISPPGSSAAASASSPSPAPATSADNGAPEESSARATPLSSAALVLGALAVAAGLARR